MTSGSVRATDGVPRAAAQGLASASSGGTQPDRSEARATAHYPSAELSQTWLGFGDLHGPKPYKFIRFGDLHGPKPYKSIGFGDIHGPNPYKST